MGLTKPAARRGNKLTSAACLASLSLSLLLSPLSTNALYPDEKQALEKLYNSLDGSRWDIKWNITVDNYCTYPGVVCDDKTHVIELNLPDNNLVGTITPHLYLMPYLKKIDFSKNSISDAGWNKINEVLDQVGDELIGTIQVVDLTSNRVNTLKGIELLKDSLTGLHMTYNNLRGPMPDELFQLHNLRILAISENGITGEIDTRIGTLTNLKEFYCYGNEITGSIPSEIGKLTKMQVLTFAENKLSGTLPEEIKNMGNLQTFSVHNNDPGTGAHSGPLPRFDTHPFLNEIYLDGNEFTAEIPHLFLHLSNQTDKQVTIGLSHNKLQGTVPFQLLKFKSLVLNIVGNNISGIDPRICESDSINAWMNGLCPVNFYSKVGRQEDDDAPCVNCSAGTNGVMGATECGTDQEDITELEILADFYLSVNGPQWDEAEGWDAMSKIESPEDLTLPSYQEVEHCNFYGVTCMNGQVIELALPLNGLEGMVPSSLFDLPALKVLDLSGNELHFDREYGFGAIANAKSLEKADLSSNDIQTFGGLGKATTLKELYVDDAYFFASLNPAVYQMKELRILHMRFSGLKGKIPDGLSGLSNLRA